MIYDGDAASHGLSAIMFPVEAVPVFAETEPGRRERIPGKTALINSDSRRVLSVVSERYQVLHNAAALDLAYAYCTKAFPNTAPANWYVFSIEAPMTGGHCRIDLKYRGELLAYDWAFSTGMQDRFEPFVRVTNSYNRVHAFSLHFGFIRWACTNGLVQWGSRIKISVAHNTKEMEKDIERALSEAKFRKAKEDLRKSLDRLSRTPVARPWFRGIVLSVLRISRPRGMPVDRVRAWEAFERAIDHKVEQYIEECGENAYALMNVVTDLATQPQVDAHDYSFIRRERHTLQRLAGTWVGAFGRSLADPSFDVSAYLKRPSQQLLQRFAEPRHSKGSGHNRRS